MLNLRARCPAALATLLLAGLACTAGAATVNGFANGGFEPAATVSAVPEPETYALLMAGLGLVATVARRRRN